MSSDAASTPSARPSRSHDAARRAQIERELAMTPMERLALALSLGRRSAELARRRRDETTES